MGIRVVFLVILIFSGKTVAADLQVTVQGVRSSLGQLRLAMFNQAKEFPEGQEVRSLDIDAKSGTTVALFKSMPPGVYAIALHHDENSNKNMDINFIGLPKEGYGFSSDAQAIFGPPTFDAASFEFGNKDKKIRMRVLY